MAKTVRRAKPNRREQMFLAQHHAWEHFVDRRSAKECRGYSTAPREWRLQCPICMRRRDFSELTEEHAPQQSGVSFLGRAECVVLTCEECNHDANHLYEKKAANPSIKVDHGLPGACPVPTHGVRVDESRAPLLQVVDEKDATLADIKSAFVIAFATLGYGWSHANEVKAIRKAIRTGDLPPEGTCSIVKLAGVEPGNVVLQMSGPQRCVLVQELSGWAMQLPSHGARQVPPLGGEAARLRHWDWPVTIGNHNQVWTAREAGNLFHADFCHRHRW